MKPQARVGDACISPQGIPGTIVTGAAGALVNGFPAARVGDRVLYANGTASIIAQGSPHIMIGGRPAACIGDTLVDGGRIVGGSPTVVNGLASPGVPTVASATATAARRDGRAFVRTTCERDAAVRASRADG